MVNNNIGQRIKERRNEMDLSASQLADRLSMSKATIYRYESGEIKDIKMPVIEAMAQVLRVNPLWLIGESEIKHPNAHRDFALAINDLLIFVNSAKTISYKGNKMDEKDLEFLRYWVYSVEAHFKSRYE